jgi:hypothetical protein
MQITYQAAREIDIPEFMKDKMKRMAATQNSMTAFSARKKNERT